MRQIVGGVKKELRAESGWRAAATIGRGDLFLGPDALPVPDKLLKILAYDVESLLAWGISQTVANSWTLALARGEFPQVGLDGSKAEFTNETFGQYVENFLKENKPNRKAKERR